MINLFDEKQDCCGCTACMSICPVNAIVMEKDDKGFLYPKINYNKCINCNRCKDVCAFKKQNNNKNLEMPIFYACKHKKDKVRITSTSGGMFTALSDHIFDLKGSVYGAVFDSDFNVYHIKSENKKNRDKMKGSKYLQSDLKETFFNIFEDLKNNKSVLFCGTPCQTAGLKSYLKMEKADISSLYICDLICHGVPSPLIWQDFLKLLKNKYHSNPKEVNFRCKEFSNGNSGMKIVFGSNKNEKAMIYKNDLLNDYYFNLYTDTYILRESCFKCPYTNIYRPSDITIGDFWGIDNVKPNFNDNKGVSLVIANTKKGEKLFKNISNKLIFENSNLNECIDRQQQLKEPCDLHPNYSKFWQDYYKKGFKYCLIKYTHFGLKFRIIKKLENTIYLIIKKLHLLKIIKKLFKR